MTPDQPQHTSYHHGEERRTRQSGVDRESEERMLGFPNALVTATILLLVALVLAALMFGLFPAVPSTGKP